MVSKSYISYEEFVFKIIFSICIKDEVSLAVPLGMDAMAVTKNCSMSSSAAANRNSCLTLCRVEWTPCQFPAQCPL